MEVTKATPGRKRGRLARKRRRLGKWSLEREIALGVDFDSREVLCRLRSVRFGRQRKESENAWIARVLDVIVRVWNEAKANFVSADEWRRSDLSPAMWGALPSQSVPLDAWPADTVRGTSLPMPPKGWQPELPPRDDMIREWIKPLAPTYLGASRRKLLAAQIVGWRWGLSASAVLSKRLAWDRTEW